MWTTWRAPGGKDVLSCALLSKEAAPALTAIHHRMPVVLKPEHMQAWMDPQTTAADVQRFIADARGDFEGYRVSTRVNSARNDGEELLARIGLGEKSLDGQS